MTIAWDDDGYAYDVDTGYYLTVEWDELGNAYNAATGEMVDYVMPDSSGSRVYTGSGSGIDWNQLFMTAAQAYAAGQGAAQSGRYIPQQTQSPYGYETLNRPPAQPPIVTPSPRPSGSGVGLNISTNTLMLIVGGFLLFMLGSRKR